MANSFAQAFAEQRASLKAQARNAKELVEKCKAANIPKLVAALVAAEPTVNCYMGSYTIIINVPVKSMKHMLDVIEAAEMVTGFEFDQSEDQAQAGQRRFSSTKAWWLTIVAVVPLEAGADQLCRRVQTGVQTVEQPVYALECTDPL